MEHNIKSRKQTTTTTTATATTLSSKINTIFHFGLQEDRERLELVARAFPLFDHEDALRVS